VTINSATGTSNAGMASVLVSVSDAGALGHRPPSHIDFATASIRDFIAIERVGEAGGTSWTSAPSSHSTEMLAVASVVMESSRSVRAAKGSSMEDITNILDSASTKARIESIYPACRISPYLFATMGDHAALDPILYNLHSRDQARQRGGFPRLRMTLTKQKAHLSPTEREAVPAHRTYLHLANELADEGADTGASQPPGIHRHAEGAMAACYFGNRFINGPLLGRGPLINLLMAACYLVDGGI